MARGLTSKIEAISLIRSSFGVRASFSYWATLYPIQLAFAYWMRCSEFSADRAAIICDGSAEKTTEVMMRFAGYDKDIMAEANVEAFMEQALEGSTDEELKMELVSDIVFELDQLPDDYNAIAEQKLVPMARC